MPRCIPPSERVLTGSWLCVLCGNVNWPSRRRCNTKQCNVQRPGFVICELVSSAAVRPEANDEVMVRSLAVEGGADLRVEHDLGSLSPGKRQHGADTDGDVHGGMSPRQSLKDSSPLSLAKKSCLSVIPLP
jgi:hypothetical protein